MGYYLVLAMRNPEFDAAVVEPHREFLQTLSEQGLLELARPFFDQSGGAYLLKATSMAQARAVAHADPVHTSGSSVLTVYEWNAR